MTLTDRARIASPRRVSLAFVGLAGAVALVAAACSSEDAADGLVGGGSAECTEDELTEAAGGAAESDGTQLQGVVGFECADGWAVVFADVGDNDETSVTVTYLFQAEGQFWALNDRASACAEPSDVPASIFTSACETN